MKNRILVDTTIWIEFFREKGSPISARLQEYLKLGQACYAGPIEIELYQGAKTQKELQVLDQLFEAITYVEITRKHYHLAGLTSQKAARKGKTFSVVDMVLAITAQEEQLFLFSLDTHFKEIARYCMLSLVPLPEEMYKVKL